MTYRSLYISILYLAIRDYTRETAVNNTWAKDWSNAKDSSMAFFNSEWCRLICQLTDISYLKLVKFIKENEAQKALEMFTKESNFEIEDRYAK
jgi:hypothetical protein